MPLGLLKLAIPMIFGMLGLVVFNLTDTFFVGQLGSDQLAALSFTFPVVLFINSISIGIGLGSSALISRHVGEQNEAMVKRLATDSLMLGITFLSVVVVIGLLTVRSLFSLMGAEGVVLDYITEYMIIWYPGMVFVVVPMIGNNIIRALGDTKTPGIVMGISAITNIILDPLLIFGIGPFPQLGIGGAALATVIARGLTAVAAAYVLHFREQILVYHRVRLREVLQSWKRVLYIGIPNAFINMALPLGSGIVTRILSTYGAEVVAGFGVATRIEFFALAFTGALASVTGPFIGQNLGAGKLNRVILGKKTGELFSLAIGAIMAAILFVFARPIARIFNDNPAVVDTIVIYIRIVPVSYGLQGILRIGATILNVLNKPFHSSGLMVAQTFLIYIPLALLTSPVWGIHGIFASLAVSYAAAGGLAHFQVQRQLDSQTSVTAMES